MEKKEEKKQIQTKENTPKESPKASAPRKYKCPFEGKRIDELILDIPEGGFFG